MPAKNARQKQRRPTTKKGDGSVIRVNLRWLFEKRVHRYNAIASLMESLSNLYHEEAQSIQRQMELEPQGYITECQNCGAVLQMTKKYACFVCPKCFKSSDCGG